MSDTIISIENISKSYLVGHQSGEGARYTALRDVIAREARNFTRKAVDVFRGRQIIQGDEVEEFWALKGVSFEVKRGEVVGLIGRNGAGKSTLLKILSRITEPTEGRILLGGRTASLLEVGTGFHPELTGRENIFLNGAILGMTRKEIRAKFDEIVAFSGVERFMDTPVKYFSTGMYVRLAFAVAAHLEPEILIVDEVLAVGDAEFQKKCLGKMSEISRGGRTILFVSHNLTAVRNLCSHAVVLQNGAASPKQDVESAINQYTSKYHSLATTSWTRPAQSKTPKIYFESIDVQLDGEQPALRLECRIAIKSTPAALPVAIAVDIHDDKSTCIMQAIPQYQPFIGGDGGTSHVDMTIELPPLVPGTYPLTFWIGTPNYETQDFVGDTIAIKITDPPDPERTYPHYKGQGFVIAKSTAVVRAKPQLIKAARR
jgi:lipopolysaccharide transport system ATP-binding protein